jgi:ABC-type oligopeptide transport system substrate-binding subunit
MDHQVLAEKDFSLLFSQMYEKMGDSHQEKKKAFQVLQGLSKELSPSSFFECLEGTLTLTAHSEKGFIQARETTILAWLIQKLSFPSPKNSLDFFEHEVSYPFCSKQVLGLFFEIHSLWVDFEMIKKMVLAQKPHVVFAHDSYLSSTNTREGITKIYFEVYKDGENFHTGELLDFQRELSKKMFRFLEKPEPQFLVPSNREILLKSFRWVMRDLEKGDMPHVYIDFNRHTGNFCQFSVLICQVLEKDTPSLKKILVHPDIYIEVNSSFNQGGLKTEGAILTIDIPYHPSFSILDARKECFLLLQSLIGTFRDINGGILEQIKENFDLFSKLFPPSESNLDRFFYGIFPQEQQATASPLFLKMMYTAIQKEEENDLELNCSVHEEKDQICITIKTPDPSFEKELRHNIWNHFPQIVFASSLLKKGMIISCGLFMTTNADKLKSRVFSFYTKWHQRKNVKQVLRLCSTAKFTSFDPRIGTEEETSHLHKMLFEGLMRVDANGSPIEGIAQKVEIDPSGKLYHFSLRESRWSNGSRLTAHDFAYSWKMSLTPDFFSPLSYLFYPIKNAREIKEGKLPPSMLGVKVIDDLTLEVELNHPTPYFLELCTHSSFSPICRLTDLQNPSWPKSQGNEYVCNGPFTLEKISKTDEMQLRKNPNYWDENNVHFSKVIISNTTDKKALSLFTEGKVDALLYPFCRPHVLNLPKNLEHQKVKGPIEIRYLYFNCSIYPFSHTKLRQSFSLALNRQALAPLFADNAVPYYAPFAPKFTQIDANAASEENPDLARRLFEDALQELGISRETIMHEKIYAVPSVERLVQSISKQLNILFGLSIEPIIVSTSTFWSLMIQRKMPLFSYSWINRIQSPSYFLDCFSSSKNILNHTAWANKEIICLIQEIENTQCTTQRNKLYAKAERLLYVEKPFIPLSKTPIYSVVHPYLNNLHLMDSQQFELRHCYKD